MDTRIAYTALVGLIIAERFAETEVSRRHAAWSFAHGGAEHGGAHYPVMVLLHVGLLAGCLLEPWIAERPFIAWIAWPALLAVVASQAVRWWCVVSLGPRWNIRIITVPGLPLVTTGPYRWFRHPNYMAVVAEGIALPLIHSAWVTAVAFTAANLVLLRHRVRVENEALREPA